MNDEQVNVTDLYERREEIWSEIIGDKVLLTQLCQRVEELSKRINAMAAEIATLRTGPGVNR